jgi:hypothetical protein
MVQQRRLMAAHQIPLGLSGHHRTEDYHQNGYENHPTCYYFLRKEDGAKDARGTDA